MKFDVIFFLSIYREGILYGRFAGYNVQSDSFDIISNRSILCQSGMRGLVKYICGSVNAFVFSDNSSFCSYSITITNSVCNFPTIEPSYTPSNIPFNTKSPTVGPTFTFIQCAPFSVTNTNSAQRNTASCTFTACSGHVSTISNCAGGSTCINDTFTRLFNSSNNLVSFNDDFCARCSQLTYIVPLLPGQCGIYTLKQGCYSSISCSGTFSVRFSNDNPTLSPTTLVPTFISTTPRPTYPPCLIPITQIPTLNPTSLKPTIGPASVLSYVQCDPFSATNTDSAIQNTASCTFAACSGNTFLISNCAGGSTCNGDTLIRLYDSSNILVFTDDDFCGLCSK